MSQSACSSSVAVDRAASSATGPQSRHLTFKPCCRLLGCHSLGSRLQQLNRQAIGALALALEGNHRQARVLGPQRQAFSGIYKNLQRLIGARMRTVQIWSRRKPKVSNLRQEMQP